MKDIHEVLRRKQAKYAQLAKQIEALQQAAEKLREVAPLLAENEEDDNVVLAEMDDDAGMMAMMGLNGFGSTKVGTLSQLRVEPHCCWQGKHIDGNQEGTAFIKKERTWRQYMNR